MTQDIKIKLLIQKVQDMGDYCLTILFFSLYYKHDSWEDCQIHHTHHSFLHHVAISVINPTIFQTFQLTLTLLDSSNP